jgi:hypothetical protein
VMRRDERGMYGLRNTVTADNGVVLSAPSVGVVVTVKPGCRA